MTPVFSLFLLSFLHLVSSLPAPLPIQTPASGRRLLRRLSSLQETDDVHFERDFFQNTRDLNVVGSPKGIIINPENPVPNSDQKVDLTLGNGHVIERKKDSIIGFTRRDQDPPHFPHNIESCKNCEPDWKDISSCAAAAVVFQNISNVMWNPVGFVDQIKCACVDTFQAAFPQCADCFVKTHQCETYLGADPGTTPKTIQNVRSICAFGSGIFGGVGSSYASAGHSYATTMSASQPPGGTASATPSYGPGGVDMGSEQGGVGSLKVPTLTVAMTSLLGIAMGRNLL